jgi:anthranilate synthase component 1
VHVDPYRSIERYSHVMHIVSGVQGELAAGRDAFDLFAAAFPAGTLVGAPKVRAMEIIDELEPVRRGSTAARSAISAATVTWTRPSRSARWCSAANTYSYQAGAGIVADSIPESEYDEVLAKSAILREALKMAEEGL